MPAATRDTTRAPFWHILDTRISSTPCATPNRCQLGSRTSGDETALERRGHLRRFGGALQRASRDVPPGGSDGREPFQRGLAGACCRVDEVGAGSAEGRGKAAQI